MPTSWVAPQQQNSLLDVFSQAEAFKAQRAHNAFNEAKIAELPYEREREQALNEANIAKVNAQAGKAEVEMQGSDLENSLKKVELGGQILSGVRDESSYQWSRARAAKMGLGTEDWPASFDPGWVQQTQQKGMQLKDQLAQQLNERQFVEKQKQSGIDNQFQQANLGVAQGHLGVSQANAAESARHHGVMENRPNSGLSLGYDDQGRVVLGQGGMPKLTEQQGKATSYAIRGGEADGLLTGMESGGYRTGVGTQLKQWAGEKTGAPDRFQDDNTQKYRQAAGVFINAINRQDSGAAIPDVEWVRAERLYLVMPNDSDAVIEQKRQARQTALEATEVVAGPGRAALPPNTQRTPVTMVPQGGEDPRAKLERLRALKASRGG